MSWLCNIFDLFFRHLDPDPDSEYGSGSRRPLNPDPKHWKPGSGSTKNPGSIRIRNTAPNPNWNWWTCVPEEVQSVNSNRNCNVLPLTPVFDRQHCHSVQTKSKNRLNFVNNNNKSGYLKGLEDGWDAGGAGRLGLHQGRSFHIDQLIRTQRFLQEHKDYCKYFYLKCQT